MFDSIEWMPAAIDWLSFWLGAAVCFVALVVSLVVGLCVARLFSIDEDPIQDPIPVLTKSADPLFGQDSSNWFPKGPGDSAMSRGVPRFRKPTIGEAVARRGLEQAIAKKPRPKRVAKKRV